MMKMMLQEFRKRISFCFSIFNCFSELAHIPQMCCTAIDHSDDGWNDPTNRQTQPLNIPPRHTQQMRSSLASSSRVYEEGGSLIGRDLRVGGMMMMVVFWLLWNEILEWDHGSTNSMLLGQSTSALLHVDKRSLASYLLFKTPQFDGNSSMPLLLSIIRVEHQQHHHHLWNILNLRIYYGICEAFRVGPFTFYYTFPQLNCN